MRMRGMVWMGNRLSPYKRSQSLLTFIGFMEWHWRVFLHDRVVVEFSEPSPYPKLFRTSLDRTSAGRIEFDSLLRIAEWQPNIWFIGRCV
jgi:hypothetical protein